MTIKLIYKTRHLDEEEMRVLRKHAQDRCALKSTDDMWTTGANPAEQNFNAHFMGVISEYITALEFDGEIDDTIYGSKGDNDKPDVIAGDGTAIAVKSTQYWPPILKVTLPKEIRKADDIVLCHVDIENCNGTIIGKMSTDDFWKNCYTYDFGYGKRFCYRFKNESTQKNIQSEAEELLVF